MARERLNRALLGATKLLIAAEFVTQGVGVIAGLDYHNLRNQSNVAYSEGDLNKAQALFIESETVGSIEETTVDLGLKLILPAIPIFLYSGTELVLKNRNNRRKLQSK